MQPVICIFGPTCTGKTAAAIALAQLLPVEIISADSSMVYRGLDIGTAKPSLQERQHIPHHLIDIRDPDQPYSSGDFYQDSQAALARVHQKNKYPIVVGGTMLYFNALHNGLHDLPKANPTVRLAINERAKKLGWAALHLELSQQDPITAARIHPNDPQRIQRALEIIATTHRTPSELQAQPCPIVRHHFINCILTPNNRPQLHQNIALRFNDMLTQGFVEEVRQLQKNPKLHAELPAIRSVGYRQIWHHLITKTTQQNMIDTAQAATRQLAKRQITWLKRWPQAKRFDCHKDNVVDDLCAYVHQALQSFNASC